jgi:hypothetical protein
MQERISRVQPTEGRKKSVRFHPKPVPQFIQPGCHRQNPIASNQPVDLGPKRPEGDEVNQSKEAQKPASRVIESGPTDSVFPLSPEERGHSRSERAMSGDKTIPVPSGKRKAGKPAITPESEAAPEARSRAEHPKDGFRSSVDRSVGLDQVNGGAKTFD